jgi:hypothetical protein
VDFGCQFVPVETVRLQEAFDIPLQFLQFILIGHRMKPFSEMTFVELFVAAMHREPVLQHPIENLGGLEVQRSDRGMPNSVPALWTVCRASAMERTFFFTRVSKMALAITLPAITPPKSFIVTSAMA